MRLSVAANVNCQQPLIDKKKYDKLCLEAIKISSGALAHVNPNKLSDEKVYDEICLEAVQGDIRALQLVNENNISKETYTKLCNLVSAQDNWLAYYPLYKCLQKNNPIFEKKLREFLSTVQHIVVTENKFVGDNELQDVYSVYANHPHRKGTTIQAGKEYANELLALVKEMNVKNNINLAFLGHANVDSADIAGVSKKKMVRFLEQFDNINRVTLLGCSTGKSLMSNKEAEIIKKTAAEKNVETVGLVLFGKACHFTGKEDPRIAEFLTTIQANTKQSQVSVYMLSETDNPEIYKLVHVHGENNPLVMTKKSESILDKTAVKKLFKLNKEGQAFEFKTKISDQPIWLRGGKQQKTLEEKEISLLSQVFHGRKTRFDKTSPEYKLNKQKHPFLTSVKLSEAEAVSLLQKSLLEDLFTCIRNSNSINRDLTIKGYTNSLQVDTHQKGLHVYRTYSYSKSYKSFNKTFFEKNEESIDYKKIANDQKIILRKYHKLAQDKEIEPDTTFKSIIVQISKKS